ncbi:MAG: hypothetical protein EOO72_08375, partial [Myxococcaceae bacterium]
MASGRSPADPSSTSPDRSEAPPVRTAQRAPAREDGRESQVSYVMSLIAHGHLGPRHDLLLARRWGVQPKAAREVIAEARRAWRRALDPDERRDLVLQLEARLDRIYR